MKYWLIKTEPAKWSWEQQLKVPSEPWDGVRNYQASNNLKAMEIEDQAFFYHSVTGTEIMGIVEVCRTYYPDPTDPKGRFGMVDVRAVKSLKRPVTLHEIKSNPHLQDLPLIRQSRLSVMPIPVEAWEEIFRMSER